MVDKWSRRSLYGTAIRVLRWIGNWSKDVLGVDAPETKALAEAFRAVEAGAKREGVEVKPLARGGA